MIISLSTVFSLPMLQKDHLPPFQLQQFRCLWSHAVFPIGQRRQAFEKVPPSICQKWLFCRSNPTWDRRFSAQKDCTFWLRARSLVWLIYVGSFLAAEWLMVVPHIPAFHLDLLLSHHLLCSWKLMKKSCVSKTYLGVLSINLRRGRTLWSMREYLSQKLYYIL